MRGNDLSNEPTRRYWVVVDAVVVGACEVGSCKVADESAWTIPSISIPDNVKQGLEIVPVKWIDKVLAVALERKPVALTDEEVAAQVAAGSVSTGASSSDTVKH